MHVNNHCIYIDSSGVRITAAQMETLVNDLRRSFQTGKTMPYKWRVAQLEGILRLMNEREKEIMEALWSDLAKPRTEAYLHEISLSKAGCKFALKELKNWMKPEKVPSLIATFSSTAQIVPEPLGVVLVISAWNYPFALIIDPLIGAVAAGNAVVLKPSEVAPSTSAFFAKFLPHYVDTSCIQVVEGGVTETTELLEQKWDKIFYTGSGTVGRIVMAAAAKHLTPVALELGGKCPVVFDSDVNLKVAVKRMAIGKWGCNNGQACIAPDYIITTKSFAPKLVDAFKETLKEFYGEDPLESADLSRIVSSNHFRRLTDFLDEENIPEKIVHGGGRDEKHLKIAPTVLLDVPHDSLIMKDEIFGPLLPIITVEKLEDCFELINSRPKPLAAYLFSKNKRLEEEFVQKVFAGGILINDVALHVANPHLPFGGVGESGTGAYHGKFSFDTFSHKKAVLSRGYATEMRIRARYPPYTHHKQIILRRVIDGSFIALFLGLFGLHRD
ncbi:Aldehyde dehydrogenase [Rhynchospora pubera]|uniref:Aldehyde dehydrogenase n=1 Tax=Rhynchospora pubera TaxID=906938 RepID=A0AAV8FNX1_9POAL|nr:Aldehyde dehydrogenase [Rhynchospora pubera]